MSDNHLSNGTVLPYGLLSVNTTAAMTAFNRTYQNTKLRMGIVLKAYAATDPGNYSGLCTEYDVVVLEQNENISSTNMVYRNCISAESGGSIADFFEKNLRTQITNKNPNGAINTANQNGAIALIECLDGYTNKAIVIGALIHPDRETTLTNTEPQLQGEYNGVNVAVGTDGSASLTFNGPTDNNGDVINSSQKQTTLQIQKDGSVVILDAAGSMLNMTSDGSIQSITSNGNLIFLNNASNEISINQKDGSIIGLTSTGVTVSDSTGKQIVSVNGSSIQLTSGGTIVEQSGGQTINSGSVNINGSGGVKIKDQFGGELNIQNGMVALGNSTAELLDLFNQTLTQIQSLTVPTGVGPSGPPINLAAFTAIQTQLDLIKGSL